MTARSIVTCVALVRRPRRKLAPVPLMLVFQLVSRMDLVRSTVEIAAVADV